MLSELGDNQSKFGSVYSDAKRLAQWSGKSTTELLRFPSRLPPDAAPLAA
ncbi:hypothetical protein MCBRY_003393 [Methylocystis bryophila]